MYGIEPSLGPESHGRGSACGAGSDTHLEPEGPEATAALAARFTISDAMVMTLAGRGGTVRDQKAPGRLVGRRARVSWVGPAGRGLTSRQPFWTDLPPARGGPVPAARTAHGSPALDRPARPETESTAAKTRGVWRGNRPQQGSSARELARLASVVA